MAGNSNTSNRFSAPDAWGPFQSLGHNLIGNTAFNWGIGAWDYGSGPKSPGVWLGTDLTGRGFPGLKPLLGPLGNYGGPTQTMPPLLGSPAIDAGISGAGIPTTDERGLAWGNPNAPDIGAARISRGPTWSIRPAIPSTRGPAS